jgi:hypothetical protein
MKNGDFTVRFEYEQHGVLSRVGELLNDVIGLSEHTTQECHAVARRLRVAARPPQHPAA